MKAATRKRAASPREWLASALLLTTLSVAAVWWCFSQGYILYFPDAGSHLNVARRIVDSRTPGYDQLGTVWLPLPHALMLPFVWNDTLWRSGLAGSIPGSMCFIAAGLFLFGAVRRLFDSRAAAVTALALFALNPNLLYLQSTPMTEPVFFAALCGLLYATVWFAQSQSIAAILLAGFCSDAASLTRYEGWFLIPFVTLYVLFVAKRHPFLYAVLFGAIASLAPLYWFAHNWYCCADPLAFYRGPYSPKAIQGGKPYPGNRDLAVAWLYFRTAARLCAGWPLVVAGVAGAVVAVVRRAWWPVLFLILPPVFYVLSMYSSGGTPIFVPQLWPNHYYNTRYGLAVLPLLALGGGALCVLAPRKWRGLLAIVAIVTAISPWLISPRPDIWICWKESQVNSVPRRELVRQAVEFLKPRYRLGTGIIASCCGDLTEIFREAGIPLRETLHEGNNPDWLIAMTRPDLFLHEDWAVAYSADPVSTAIWKAMRYGRRYRLVKLIEVKGAQAVEIYRLD
ncbi:MAG TPA: glycosyltransferase family 39 protein [Bryobacteraceae bacterium]|nr:glycosyltransferase family 39 protein [Bryobacteraceae bacterium]